MAVLLAHGEGQDGRAEERRSGIRESRNASGTESEGCSLRETMAIVVFGLLNRFDCLNGCESGYMCLSVGSRGCDLAGGTGSGRRLRRCWRCGDVSRKGRRRLLPW